MLRKPEVRKQIRAFQRGAAEAAAATITELAKGFKRAADADIRKLLDKDGAMLPPNKWPEEIAGCVTRVEIEELSEWVDDPETGRKKKVAIGTRWKVWLENKTECRRILAQWRGMLGSDKENDKPEPPAFAPGGDADAGRL